MTGKSLQRVVRSTPLEDSEVERDASLRSLIEAEFPAAADGRTDVLSQALRLAVQQSPQPIGDLAKAAGISPRLVTEFAAGRRDLHLALAERLAKVLGLHVSVSM